MTTQGVPNNGLTLRNNLDLFKQIINDGLPIVHVFPYKLACMSYLLFDIEEFFLDEEAKTTELQLKVKNLGDGKFNLTMTDQDCAMQRWEELHVFDHAILDGAVVATDTITVLDVSFLKGITTNTKIRIQSTSATNEQTCLAIVTNVAGNVLTLDRNVTAEDGDKVFRGANLRVRCTAIDNTYELNRRANYNSYFQSIHGHITFTTCELSAHREIYTPQNGMSQLLVNAKSSALFEGLLKNDLMDIFLYGENLPEAGAQASQTRGLITTIQEAQVATGQTFIFDLAPAIGTTDDEAVIKALIEIWIRAFESGYYYAEPITAMINTTQLKQLMYMAPAFEEFFGIQMYKETDASHEGCRDYISLRVHGIEIEHGVIEFVLFEPLNAFYAEPLMILVPRSMFGMYQRKNSKVDSNMNVTEQAGVAMFPKFTFTDVSSIIYAESGGDECFKFITKLELAFVQAGIFNCAYYVIRNAKSYRDTLATGITAPTQDDIMC